MTEQIRFHLDESVDSAVADGLQRRGAHVTTAKSVGLLQAPDEEHMAFALANELCLVTHDDDFLALARQGIKHSGIAFCHAEARSIGQIIAALMLIRDCMTTDEMRNHVEFL